MILKKTIQSLSLVLICGLSIPSITFANECSCDGGMSSLTFKNNGDDTNVEIRGKKDGLLYHHFVLSGDEFTFSATDGKKGKMDNSLVINGVALHTSCSKPIGTGMEIGDLTIVAGSSLKGGDLCSIEEYNKGKKDKKGKHNDNANQECQDDGCSCDGGMDSLTFRNDGDDTNVDITGKKDGLLYHHFIPAGDEFTFSATDGKKGKMDNSLVINGVALHTSCSKPIGTGMQVGDLTIVAGHSIKGGDLCPIENYSKGKKHKKGKGHKNCEPKPITVGRVCGEVFMDSNENNTFDDTDRMLENIGVNISNEDGNIITTETTNSNGRYCASNIPEGTVNIDIDEDTLPNGVTQVVGDDPSSIEVVANENNWAGRDGYALPEATGSVCGNLFIDIDRDGKYSAVDAPLRTLDIEIKNMDTGDIIQTMRADHHGKYCVDNLEIGSHIQIKVLDETTSLFIHHYGQNPNSVTIKAGENWGGMDGYNKI